MTVRNGYIYIIVCMEYCKIGIAENPERRFSAIWPNCPFAMTFFKKYKVPVKFSAELLEKQVHFQIKKFWTGISEWFKIEPKQVEKISKK